jgi:hypothetical protein
MSIGNQNITFSSTGQTFDFRKNKLGILTSVYLTPEDFNFPESDLEDEDTMFDHMVDGNIFPLHQVHVTEPQNKNQEFSESLQDFSYKTYPGKDIYSIKFDWRLDYHQLISQFNGQNLRVIFGYNNKKFLTTATGSNVQGFKLSNITLDDIEINGTNLSPLRIELADKAERKVEVLTEAGYSIDRIDRRFTSIEVSATSTEMNFTMYHLGTEVTNLISTDVTVTDDANGELTFSFNTSGLGYLLDSFSDTLTRGCLRVVSEGYLGRNRYTAVAVVVYDNMVWEDDYNMVWEDDYNMTW